MTFNPTLAAATPQSPVSTARNVSTPNVENVVKAPRNPVPITARARVAASGCSKANSAKTPNAKHPAKFAARVPHGNPDPAQRVIANVTP